MNWEQIAYPNKDLQFLVLQLLFVEADGFIVMTAENTVKLNHSFSHRTWKLTQKIKSHIEVTAKYDWEHLNIYILFISGKGTVEERGEDHKDPRPV